MIHYARFREVGDLMLIRLEIDDGILWYTCLESVKKKDLDKFTKITAPFVQNFLHRLIFQ